MDTSEARRGRWLAVAGVVLQAGLAPFLVGLASFFSTLATSGIGDPASLGGATQEVFVAGIVESTVGLIGLIVLCVALVHHRYRAKWFFWFLIGYSVLLLFVIPVGTLFGVFFLVYCFRHLSEIPGTSA